jgi:peptidyl-prolyl cis-trans isomerase D
MSLLENLRKGTDSTTTRLMIGVIVAVFIFWGVGQGDGDTMTVKAFVNGVAVTSSAADRSFQQAVRQAGGNLTDDEEKAIYSDIVDRLIEQEALVQEARRLGIVVTEEEIAREYVKNPAFQEDGKFSEKALQRILKANRLTRATFEEDIRRQLLLERVNELMLPAVTVSESEIRDAWLQDETTLELSFVRLPVTAFYDDVTVTDAERDSFVTQNKDRIKARYDESFERFYNLKKRYQLRAILLRSDLPGADSAALRARADAVRAEALAGADFGDLARRWSEDLSASNGGQLGVQAADQLDPALAAAADKAGPGQVTEVVETSRGLQILLVEKVEDAKVISLEEAEKDIAVTMLKEERAPARAQAFAARIIEAWKSAGAPPVTLLDERRLVLDTTGEFSLADPEIPRLGADPALRQQIESAPAGYVAPVPLELKGTTMVVAVSSRAEPDPASYEAARSMVEARERMKRHRAFSEQWVADVVSRAKIERK